MGDLPQRGLGAASGKAVGRGGVEAVFQGVEIERAQVFGAIDLQLGHHRVELVLLVMRQDDRLQTLRVGQRPAVEFEHLAQRYGMLGGIEVAGIGQQKPQCVADAAITIDHAGEDFVVARNVAGIVGGGYPQADDLRAQLVAGLQRIDAVAQRLAHLAALAVHGEAVGQQPFVGRAAVHGARGEQRGMKPAAVLVMAFQIEIGLRAFGMARACMTAHEHGGVRGARVEPDFEDVSAFAVMRRVVCATHAAEDVGGAGLAPGLDAAVLHHLGGDIEDVHGAWVQFAAVLVQKKRDRHAPAPLAADAPIRPVGDHVVQARLAVLGVKAGVLNGLERHLPQRFRRLVLGEHAFAFVHADEPLRRRAIDHRHLVAPAVRVAVGDAVGGHQPISLTQGVDDVRHRLPDVLPAEQRKVGRVVAVALHRVEDVLIGHAVRNAGVEVVDAVSG